MNPYEPILKEIANGFLETALGIIEKSNIQQQTLEL